MGMLGGVLNGAASADVEAMFAAGDLRPPEHAAAHYPIPKWADGIEVQGIVVLRGDDGDLFVEQDDDNPDAFSVYFHVNSSSTHAKHAGGGVEAVADFRTAKLANAFARGLATRMKASGQLKHPVVYAF